MRCPQVVADFDASASAEGLSRAAALEQMRGTAFIERRRTDMERTFSRYETLSADLHTLEGQGPFMRAFHAARMTDTEVAGAAWEAFEPAVPPEFRGPCFRVFGLFGGRVCNRWRIGAASGPFSNAQAPPRLTLNAQNVTVRQSSIRSRNGQQKQPPLPRLNG